MVVDFARCTYPVTMVLTYRYRIKDAARRHLQRQAWAVNQVWNYCGETQNAARRHNKRSPSGFDLIKLTLGSSKLLVRDRPDEIDDGENADPDDVERVPEEREAQIPMSECSV